MGYVFRWNLQKIQIKLFQLGWKKIPNAFDGTHYYIQASLVAQKGGKMKGRWACLLRNGEPVGEGSWGGEEGWEAGAGPQHLILERDLCLVYK